MTTVVTLWTLAVVIALYVFLLWLTGGPEHRRGCDCMDCHRWWERPGLRGRYWRWQRRLRK